MNVTYPAQTVLEEWTLGYAGGASFCFRLSFWWRGHELVGCDDLQKHLMHLKVI
jgi:hypothetical protein